MHSLNFTKGLIWGFVALFVPLLILQLLLMQAGELSLSYVLDRQFDQQKRLFSSGVNQNAYEYKFAILEKLNPDIITVGSSRAMQVRSEFFNGTHTNLGGVVSNVSDLEAVAERLKNNTKRFELVFMFIDPWWFNNRYPGAAEVHTNIEFPSTINMGVIISSAQAFKRGNWLTQVLNSPNLGMHALLTNEGFAKDGSYHYVKTISGISKSADTQFSKTLGRIDGDKQRFEKNKVASVEYIDRACKAIKTIKLNASNLVVIAPPFADAVWQKMHKSRYEYIEQINESLAACASDVQYFNFTDSKTFAANDCEFIDGFHGGDTVSARMLIEVSKNSSVLSNHINTDYIDEFLAHYSGYAGGLTMQNYPAFKEVDFLKLGCKK